MPEEYFNPVTNKWEDRPEGKAHVTPEGKVYELPSGKSTSSEQIESEVATQTRRTPGFYQKYVAPPTTKMAEWMLKAGGYRGIAPPGESTEKYPQQWAEQLTPQTGTEAALTAVPFARYGKLGTGILGQMLKSGVTADVGARLGESQPGTDPEVSGVGAAAVTGGMEGLLRGGGAIARNVVSPLREWMAGRTAKGALAQLPTGTPLREAMAGTKGRTPSRLGDLVEEGGVGQKQMSARFEEGIAAVGDLPVLTPQGAPSGTKIGAYKNIRSDALYDVWNELPEKSMSKWRQKRIDLAPEPNTSKFDIIQAQTLLKEARQQSRALKRTDTLKADRLIRLADEAEDQLMASLTKMNPEAAKIFDLTNKEYAMNAAMKDILEEAVVPGGSKGPLVDLSRAQKYMWENRAELKRRLGMPNFQAVWKKFGRGADIGAMDKPGSVGGMVPWANIGGSVKMTPMGAALHKTFAGEPPLRPSQNVRAYLDALAAKQGSKLGEE